MFRGMRKALAAGIVAALLATTALAAGCATGPESSPSAETPAAPSPSLAQYSAQFPLQCETIQQTRVNAKGILIGHTVENLQEICEAPTVRDQNGDPVYDKDGNVQYLEAAYYPETDHYDIDKLSDAQLEEMNLKSGCVSCKTTRFNDIYAQQGAAAFGNVYNAEARAIVDNDYFDCTMCHDGEPSAKNLAPQLMFFPAIGGDFVARLDPKNAVCGQCHNAYDYRSSIHTEEDLQTIDAFRNGYDVDGLFETCWEDGVNFETDPATGITESYVLHPTVELFMDTKMQELGVTCVDCHMPQSTAEDGTTFTNHFSANSPLESEDSLTYCLNCHERQGIASTEDMAAFVRAQEAELAEGMAALEKREAAFKKALEQAVAKTGADDPALDDVKKLYAKVTWYDMCLVTGPSESPGSQAAMLDWRDILKKAHAACDEGMAALA
ncbi:MAG: ammonia-forming cytochrome c nitrite reductase subunit c552 [Coriobacteriia bacterium]|nr:ammonia-forming cytochrome c nitrite reductase subunit c552 [Coriobacteriia bacterium]